VGISVATKGVAAAARPIHSGAGDEVYTVNEILWMVLAAGADLAQSPQ
jgi:hypothetical protein